MGKERFYKSFDKKHHKTGMNVALNGTLSSLSSFFYLAAVKIRACE